MGSKEQHFQAMKDLADMYPVVTSAVPAATATALTNVMATPIPCTQRGYESTTTPAPVPFVELQRRDDALLEIPRLLQFQDDTDNGPLTLYECGAGPCKPGYLMLDEGRCLCLGPFSPKTKASA
jgi:hypothetical protein